MMVKAHLIGRLLYDSKSIFEDQLQSIENTSKKKGHNGVDLALIYRWIKRRTRTRYNHRCCLSDILQHPNVNL